MAIIFLPYYLIVRLPSPLDGVDTVDGKGRFFLKTRLQSLFYGIKTLPISISIE